MGSFLLNLYKLYRKSMNIFNFWKNNLIFTWLVIISLTAFLLAQGQDNPLLKTVLSFTGGGQTLSVRLRSDITETVKKYLFLLGLRDENRKLKQENAKLTAENQLLKELEYEFNKLIQFSKFSKKEPSSLLSARIVATDLLAQKQMLVINRGSQHGVRKYMGVIHPKGVIGYVFKTTTSSSQVITLFNRLSTLPVINQRSRTKGVVEVGLRSKTLILKYFDLQGQNTPDLKEGDRIVTEETRQFRSGFSVGTIHSIKKDISTARQTVLIKPTVPFTAIEMVFVVLKPQDNHKEEL